MKKFLFYFLILMAPTAFAIAPDEVCFYEHGNYQGQSFCIKRGEGGSNHSSIPNGWNDRVSSIETGAFVNVEVFEYYNFNGLAMIFEGAHNWLYQSENNISSFKIHGRDAPGFCIFEHANFVGKRHCRVHDGNNFTVDLNSIGFNDMASSIFVQKNNHDIKIIGYEHINQQGQHYNHSETNSYLVNNDNLSSLAVTAAAKICMHEHNDYLGQQWCLRIKDVNVSIPYVGDDWNDRISSISIPAGYKLEAFRHANYQGSIGQFSSSISSMGWNNDSISSFIISVDNSTTSAAVLKYGNKTWAKYHWLGAHNAHVNSAEAWWVFPNQRKSYEKLLDSGVRVLNLDIYDSWSRGNRDVYLCHDSCSGWIGTNYVSSMPTFRVALNRIGAWLRAHPLEVVTITLEDYVDHRALFDAALKNGQVNDILFNPYSGMVGGQWPTLASMVANNKRLIILTSKSSNADAKNGIGYDRSAVAENYWSLGTWGNDTTCKPRWSGVPLNDTAKAFHVSHFRNFPTLISTAVDNSYSSLITRINNQCFNASGGRTPNIILLDFVDIGSGMQIVNELNGKK